MSRNTPKTTQRRAALVREAPRQLELCLAIASVVPPADPELAAALRLDELWRVASIRLQSRRLKTPMAKPSLTFYRRRRSAGLAHLQANRIELNLDFLERNRDAMLSETVAHELAHLLIYRLYGRRARQHGVEWRTIMHEWFGLEGERTHRFDTAGLAIRRQRTHRYRCGCRQHQLSTVRHRRVQRGWRYLCSKCRQPLLAAGASEARHESALSHVE